MASNGPKLWAVLFNEFADADLLHAVFLSRAAMLSGPLAARIRFDYYLFHYSNSQALCLPTSSLLK